MGNCLRRSSATENGPSAIGFSFSTFVVGTFTGGRRKKPKKDPVVVPSEPHFATNVNGKSGWTVDEVYELTNQELGDGAFGTVTKAIHKHQHKYRRGKASWFNVAIKKTEPTILDYRAGRLETYDDIHRKCQEIHTLAKLRNGHPRRSPVLYLYEYFWKFDPRTRKGDIYLATELLGLELEEWRKQQPELMESTAKKIGNVLLNALDYMHSRGVVHRDIKLQNILFKRNGDIRTLKIVDFGLAHDLSDKATGLKDFCGSLGYIAPEIYKQNKLDEEPYRFEVDLFALGVILFRLLSGQRPFPSTQNQKKLRHDTVNLRYAVEGRQWQNVSPEALALVRKLLIGREERLTAKQAIEHEWFSTHSEDSILPPDKTFLKDGETITDDGHSEAFALTHAPTEPSTHGEVTRFWLDSSLEAAVNTLLAYDLYPGRIVENSQDNYGGLICVEEYMPSDARKLNQYIAALPRFTERECRRIVRDVANIIGLLHETGMAHRNVHLGNFLVDRDGRLMVKGLQFAQPIEENQPLTGHFGYLYNWYAFKAPEIDSDFTHTAAVDNWALGAAVYMLLTCIPPFRGEGMKLVENKHAGNVAFDVVVPSGPARELVLGLLQVNPARRMTIEQVLNCRWMIEEGSVLANHDLSVAHEGFKDFENRVLRTVQGV